MTTHPMIERIAKAIAEPRSRYIVRCLPTAYAGDFAIAYDWQVWLFDTKDGCEDMVASFAEHSEAEELKEKLDLELLARIAVEQMRECTEDMITQGMLGLVAVLDNPKTVYWAMIDQVLK